MFQDRIAQIAHLARLDPDPAALARCARQCMPVLSHIDVLGEINAVQVEPLYSPFEQDDAFRADIAESLDQRAAMLANAPETDGVFFVVPRIV